MSTPAQRAALKILEELRDKVRTHRAPEILDRRGQNMTEKERRARAENGRRFGRMARARKPGACPA